MSPRPARQRPGADSSPLTPTVEQLAVGAPAPAAATGEALRVPLSAVAANPLNRRIVVDDSAEVAELAASMREFGQMKACTVVTRAAFVEKFPALADEVEGVDYVQVDGARRRAAVPLAGLPGLAVTVDDSFVATRLRFIGATVTENLTHAHLNPIEEARQILVLVDEVGTQAAAGDELRKTGAWVTQRLNLLKLVDEVQAAVRTGEMPVREVRELHRATEAEQLAALRRWRAKQIRAEQPPGDQPAAPPQPRGAASTIRWFGQAEPADVVRTLRGGLPDERMRAIAEQILHDLDG